MKRKNTHPTSPEPRGVQASLVDLPKPPAYVQIANNLDHPYTYRVGEEGKELWVTSVFRVDFREDAVRIAQQLLEAAPSLRSREP